MKAGAIGKLRIAALLALGAGYAIAAHRFTSDPALSEYGAVLAIVPWLVIGLALAWQSSRRGLMIAACLILIGILYLERTTLLENFDWVYLIQHAGCLLALAIAFGRTLARGREPMCSRFARAVHGPLSDEVSRYTRRITLAWTVFFVAMCAISLGLFALAPLSIWSLFANLLTPVLVVLMFGAEYLVRLRVLPDFPHVGIIGSVRSIRAASSVDVVPGQTR